MKQLRQALHESGYMQFYLFFGEMNLRYRDWAVAAAGMKAPLRLLVSLFLLGEAVPASQAMKLVGEEATKDLVSARILKAEGGTLQSNSYHLLVHRGLFYFCQVINEPVAYLGEDSVALGQYQTPLWNSKVLDLCSGPGIQAMYAAQRGNRVTAVEQRRETCDIQRVNLRINHLEDRVELVNATASEFAGARTGRWDQILFNPPLVPIPGKMQVPSVRHGGHDGLELVGEILESYAGRLEAGGCFEFVGMSLLKGKGTRVQSPLLELARKRRLAGRVHLLSRHEIGGNSVVFAMHAASYAQSEAISPQTARAQLSVEYAGFRNFFLYYACLHERSAREKQVIEIVDMSATHYGGWFS